MAIEVDSGDYAVAETAIAAAEWVRAQHPDADVWMVRVGYRALGSSGGQCWRRAEWIEGVVNPDYEAVVRITSRGSAEKTRDTGTVMDTSFSLCRQR